jgi:hypothetical protein
MKTPMAVERVQICTALATTDDRRGCSRDPCAPRHWRVATEVAGFMSASEWHGPEPAAKRRK